jgi:hypothetical protein
VIEMQDHRRFVFESGRFKLVGNFAEGVLDESFL